MTNSNIVVRGGDLIGTNATQVDFVLLDASSSMTDKWWDTIDAIDAYITGLRKGGVASHFLMASFSSVELQYMWRDGLLADVRLMADDPPGQHGGATPLYDAINVMARRLRKLDPKRARVAIFTDGEEIGSAFTTLEQAKTLLDWMRLRGWQVTFIGADFDNTQMAAGLGANMSSVVGTASGRLADVTRLLAERSARHYRSGDDVGFTDEERTKFGGYLGHGG